MAKEVTIARTGKVANPYGGAGTCHLRLTIAREGEEMGWWVWECLDGRMAALTSGDSIEDMWRAWEYWSAQPEYVTFAVA
jgi:hypothetical protein